VAAEVGQAVVEEVVPEEAVREEAVGAVGAVVMPAVAVMLSDILPPVMLSAILTPVYADGLTRTGSAILTPVHADGPTRTGSARECFEFVGTITFGLAVGLVAVGSVAARLVAALLFGSNNARPSLVGMCGDTRRTCAISTGLTRISG
jgi:hypothetical protein